MGVHVAVVRVFTDAAGAYGNPLGIVSAGDVAPAQRQSLAARLGFSETVFYTVRGATADAQIFTPAVELPFAGHPTVGLAWWLREQARPVESLAVPAGSVAVGGDADVTLVHARPDWAPEFVFHDLDSPDAVEALDPAAFRDGHHYAWAWADEAAGALRSRMFAPDMGVAEDEATGAAAVRITARLGRDLTITQGRGSQIFTRWDPAGSVELGGRVVADPSLQV